MFLKRFQLPINCLITKRSSRKNSDFRQLSGFSLVLCSRLHHTTVSGIRIRFDLLGGEITSYLHISDNISNISYHRLGYESYSFIIPDIFQIVDEDLDFYERIF